MAIMQERQKQFGLMLQKQADRQCARKHSPAA